MAVQSRKILITTSPWNTGQVVPGFYKAVADQLAECGQEVMVLVDKQKRGLEQDAPYRIRTWPSRRPTKFADAVFFWKILKYFRPDTVITSFGAVNIVLTLSWLMGVKHRISWYHSMSGAFLTKNELFWIFVDSLQRFFKSIIYAFSTHIIAVCTSAKQDFVGHYFVNPKKCHVFHNALPDPLRANPELNRVPANGMDVVCVGRLHPMKGQDVLIRAFAAVHERYPEARLSLIGDGPYRSQLERLASQLGLGLICSFLGNLPHERVMEETASARVVVLPTISDAMPIVVIEAMALSKPVVASAVGGIPEILRDGVEGFLVPPDQPDVLAEKIQFLLENPAEAVGLGSRGRKTFTERFEQTAAVQRMVGWLLQMNGA